MIGIYKITNNINGKIYIGQSWTLERRLQDHRKNRYHNEHLTRAIKKYGVENFTFEIIRTFSNNEITQSLLDAFEGIFLEQYDCMNSSSGYNKKGAGSRGKNSEETKKLMSVSQTGKKASMETRKIQSEKRMGVEPWNKGMVGCFTKEALKKKSDAMSGEKHPFWGTHRSEETKKKSSIAISKAKKGKHLGSDHCRARKVKNIDTNEIFNSIIEATKKYNAKNITEVCKGKRNSSGGFRWEYVL